MLELGPRRKSKPNAACSIVLVGVQVFPNENVDINVILSWYNGLIAWVLKLNKSVSYKRVAG